MGFNSKGHIARLEALTLRLGNGYYQREQAQYKNNNPEQEQTFHIASSKPKMAILCGVFLPRSLHTRQNSQAGQHDPAHNDPLRWNVKHDGGINEAADENQKTDDINPE
jgi:hypothetical protein